MTLPAVSLITGIRVRHDAISNAITFQHDVLAEAGYDVRVYCLHSEHNATVDEVVVPDVWRLASEDHYQRSELIVFHFGVYYDLFNALVLDHPTAVRVVHFHNVTPPELLSGHQRWAATTGLDQIAIASRADWIWSDSAHNTEVLLDHADVRPERIVEMPLHVPNVDHPRRARPSDGHRRVLTVGRFSEAKGLLDLLDAIELLAEAVPSDLSVTLAGSAVNSSDEFVGRLRTEISRRGLDQLVEMVIDPTDEELAALYGAADVFVSPSHHEGFCIPVIEALASGCRVVVTDAGASPDTLGGFGTVVPVRDAPALAVAIERAFALPVAPPGLDEYVRSFGRAAFRARTISGAEAALASRSPAAGGCTA